MRSTPKCDIMAASSRGFVSMKTKIIYISGNEVFNMADIRAAFEEVRNTLGLGTDTIMFGVPVDNDDAFNNAEPTQPQQPAPISDDTDTMVPNTDSPAAEMIHPTDIPVSITDDTPVDKQPVKNNVAVQNVKTQNQLLQQILKWTQNHQITIMIIMKK